MARASKYTTDKDSIIERVLGGMRSGLSAYKACQAAGVPLSTFVGWCDADPDLADKYARAREELIEGMAAEILELSDSAVPLTHDGKQDWQAIQQRKLQVDSRKWLLSKLAPKKYGDKLEVSGDPERPLTIEKIERVIIG
jgi:hypothetical protein